METKMTTIPFDLERAKRIQAGKEPGKIKTCGGHDARIVCWDVKGKMPIIACVTHDDGEFIYRYFSDGNIWLNSIDDDDLTIEIPEYTQFKDGDILGSETCVFILNKHGQYKTSCYVGIFYEDLSFGGAADENNISNYSYATEKQKQQLINALKKSTDPRAKQYLKRFFGIEEKHKFEPFDKVLVRDNDNKWCADFFSHFDSEEKYQPFICVGGITDECIPYNDQTKHLLGTTDNWEG